MPPNSKNLLKKGKKYIQEEGGPGLNPHKKKKIKTTADYRELREPVVR